MSRYIDADALELDADYDGGEYWAVSMAQILNAPTIEPERKKGEWTKDCACEICGFKPWYERDIHTLSFCPNCGADMRGDDHDL